MNAHPVIRRLDPAGYRQTPWKNGGGVMTDIAERRHPGAEPGAWSGFVWRFARTPITVSAPFSDLSGYERVLTLLSGRGLVLRRLDGGEALDVRVPLRPTRFDGGWPIRSELEAGPVEVLNLVGDQASVAIDVRIPAPGDEIEAGPGEHVAYAAGGPVTLAIGHQALSLRPDEAALFETEAPVRVMHRTGTLALASIRPLA